MFQPTTIRYFSFQTGRGKAHIWRINADGSNQTQVTKNEGGFPIYASPDGRWVYYHHGLNRTLWRVSLENGEEQPVYDKPKSRFAVSPDGLHFAFIDKQGGETFIVVASTDDKKIIKTIKWKDLKSYLIDILWLPDGKNLAYISADGEFENNALWIQPLDNPIPKKIADLGDGEISESSGFAVSPDGKSFTVTQGGWLHNAVLLKGLK